MQNKGIFVMKFQDHGLDTAYQLGAYRAIAEMMRDKIFDLASSDNEFERAWIQNSLVSLAQQLDEAKEKFEKKVDAA